MLHHPPALPWRSGADPLVLPADQAPFAVELEPCAYHMVHSGLRVQPSPFFPLYAIVL